MANIDSKFERLKEILFFEGKYAIEGFLGYELDIKRDCFMEMDFAYSQKSKRELNRFYAKYNIG